MVQVLYFALLLTFTIPFQAQSQIYRFPKDSADRNPFARDKVIMHEQELMILTDNITGSLTSNTVQHRIYNLSPLPSMIAGPAYYSSVENEGNRRMYAAAGDFYGDEREEVVAAWQSGQDIFISIPSIDATTFTIGTSLTTNVLTGPLAAGSGGGNAGRIIIRSCNLDGDEKDEFASVYRNANDGLLHINLFDVDSASGNIIPAGTIADESLYVINVTSYESFDFITEDLDFDGRMELILTGTQNDGTNHNLFCKIYTVSGSGSSFTIAPKAKAIYENSISNSKVVYLKATTGDFNGDLISEIAVSYNFQLDTYPSPLADTYIKVLMAADSIATTPFQPDYTEVLLVSPVLYTTNQNENIIYNFSMDAADIDGDGHDEIVVSYDGFTSRVLKALDDMSFVLMTNIGNANPNAIAPLYDNFMSVSDVNRDGFYDIVNVSNYIDQNSNPFQQKLGIVIHTWDSTTASFLLLVAENELEIINESNGGFERQFTIALGDFDLDRIRFGSPKKLIYSQMKHPLVILNSPPVHFDTLATGMVTDVAGVFPSPPVNNDFRVEYSSLTSQTMTLQTKENSDWGASAEVKFNDSVFGFGIERNLKLKFGAKFSNTQSSINTVTVSTLNTAYTDDLIYGWITDYLVYEYPVIIDDTTVGYITSMVPVNGQKTWFGGTEPLGFEVVLNHEPGNILSYPDYTSLIQDPEIQQGIKADFGNTYSVGPATSFQWGMLFSDINTFATDTTISAGVEASIQAGGLRKSLKLSGSYDFSTQSTLTNTIQNDIKFDIFMGPLAGGIPDPHYRVNPYLVWSRDGSVTLNYSVHPETPSTGFPNTWWWQHYQQQDPALILPWRLFPEKGFPLLDQSKRTLSKSMWFSHKNPAPGDTVDIFVRVHNFSVSPTTGPVEVQLYLGDPLAGGVLLSDTAGQTSVFTSGPIIKQGREMIKFTWIAPQGLINDPRIFAWLDPQQNMTEVHEANNIGWIPLGLNYPVGIDENETFVNTRGILFPNPAKDHVTLQLQTRKACKINIAIYDMMGSRIMDYDENLRGADEQHIPVSLAGIASGIYIIRVKLPEETIQIKLVVQRP